MADDPDYTEDRINKALAALGSGLSVSQYGEGAVFRVWVGDEATALRVDDCGPFFEVWRECDDRRWRPVGAGEYRTYEQVARALKEELE